MEIKSFEIELKAVNDEPGTFEGYCSVFGSTAADADTDGDVVLKGAFADSLARNGGVVPILWQHDPKEPIGWNMQAREDDHGLWVKGQLFPTTHRAKQAREFMRLGLELKARVGLSIGYNAEDKYFQGGARFLKKLDWMEYSPVTWAANVDAMVTAVKSVVPYQALPLADESRGWDGAAAKGRVWAWATAEGKIDFGKARKCFLWYDGENTEEKGSYKMPIADIIDGSPHVVFKAVSSAAADLNGAHGQKPSIPASDIEACKHHLARYYKKFGKDSPFKDAGKSGVVPDPAGEVPSAAGEGVTIQPDTGVTTVKDFNTTLQENQKREDHMKSLRQIHKAHRDAMEAVYSDKSMNVTQKKAAVEANLHQFAKAMTDWHHQNLDMGSEQKDGYDGMGYMAGAGPEESKAGRKISAATKAKIDAACESMKSALNKHKEGMALIGAAHEMCKGLAVEDFETGPAAHENDIDPATDKGAPVVANEDVKSIFQNLSHKAA